MKNEKELKSWPIKGSSSRRVVARNISCFAIPRTETLRGDDMARRAFTLIELLVVVLIIGILAAIALPQYQKAVDRARMIQLVTLTTAAKNAQEEFYLANGTYSQDWDSLSISFSGTANGRSLTTEGYNLTFTPYVANSTPESIYARDSRLPGVLLIVAYSHSGFSFWDNVKACYATKTNSRAVDLCRLISGQSTGEDNGSEYVFKF